MDITALQVGDRLRVVPDGPEVDVLGQDGQRVLVVYPDGAERWQPPDTLEPG